MFSFIETKMQSNLQGYSLKCLIWGLQQGWNKSRTSYDRIICIFFFKTSIFGKNTFLKTFLFLNFGQRIPSRPIFQRFVFSWFLHIRIYTIRKRIEGRLRPFVRPCIRMLVLFNYRGEQACAPNLKGWSLRTGTLQFQPCPKLSYFLLVIVTTLTPPSRVRFLFSPSCLLPTNCYWGKYVLA